MLNLGGHVLGFPSENVSSASKGESVADTIRVISCYADIVAMRHPRKVRRSALPATPAFRSSMRATAAISTPPRP